MGAGWLVVTVEVASLAVMLGALVLAYRGVRDQLWLMTYAEYTKRYSEVMSGLPFEARRPKSLFEVELLAPEERLAVLRAMRSYFNLCSEELYLRQRGRIDSDTWDFWKQGIAEVTKFPCFQYAWAQLRDEYESYAAFQTFIDGQLAGASPDARVRPAGIEPARMV